MHGIRLSNEGPITTLDQQLDRGRGLLGVLMGGGLLWISLVMWVLLPGSSSFSVTLGIACITGGVGLWVTYPSLGQLLNTRRYQINVDVLTITEGPVPGRPTIRLEQIEIERIYVVSHEIFVKNRGMVPRGVVRADTEMGLVVDLTHESENMSQLNYLAEQLRTALVVPEGLGFAE